MNLLQILGLFCLGESGSPDQLPFCWVPCKEVVVFDLVICALRAAFSLLLPLFPFFEHDLDVAGLFASGKENFDLKSVGYPPFVLLLGIEYPVLVDAPFTRITSRSRSAAIVFCQIIAIVYLGTHLSEKFFQWP